MDDEFGMDNESNDEMNKPHESSQSGSPVPAHRPNPRSHGKDSRPGSSVEDPLQTLRVPLPRGKEVFGIVEQRLGSSRMKVRCLDAKSRICRIPGRLKRKLWVRENDIVVVEPWEFGGEDKGDIIYKYRPIQVQWLKSRGYLKKLEESEEF